MNWLTERPTEPGWYWCQQYQYRRIVQVWRGGTSKLLYTSERGPPRQMEDSMYDDARWWGPIDEPE